MTQSSALKALGFVMAMLVGAAALIWFNQRTTPDLDGIDTLLNSKRFSESEARIETYLKTFPRSVPANILMAQIALTRPDPKPQLALRHLARVDESGRGIVAVVRLNQGKAYSILGKHDQAEASWLEALRLDPLVPEAGWALLGLYYVQGRRDEAGTLALRLHASEPDPRDRVRLLLELLRQDAQPIGAYSRVTTFEPIVRDHPDELHATIALGLALIRDSRPDRGLSLLRDAITRHPDSVPCRLALLQGLDDAARPEELPEALDHLPNNMRDDARFDRFRGVAATALRDWRCAAAAFLGAWRNDPSDQTSLFRLIRTLRASGRNDEAERYEPASRAAAEASKTSLPLYERANAVPDLGASPDLGLYREIAKHREHAGRPGEALAWHRLILKEHPDDSESLTAIARMEGSWK